MLVVFVLGRAEQVGVDERDVRERARRQVRIVLGGRKHMRRGSVAHVLEEEGAVRSLGGVYPPRDRELVEQIEDRCACQSERVVADVTKRCPREQIQSVGERLGECGGEVAVTRRECVVQAIVKGEVGLVVVAHRPAAGRVGPVGVRRGEAVHRTPVDLGVRPVPAVVEVGNFAVRRLVERRDRRIHGIRGVRVPGQRLGLVGGLALRAELREVGVGRAVLLHHDDDVIERQVVWIRRDTGALLRRPRHLEERRRFVGHGATGEIDAVRIPPGERQQHAAVEAGVRRYDRDGAELAFNYHLDLKHAALLFHLGNAHGTVRPCWILVHEAGRRIAGPGPGRKVVRLRVGRAVVDLDGERRAVGDGVAHDRVVAAGLLRLGSSRPICYRARCDRRREWSLGAAGIR